MYCTCNCILHVFHLFLIESNELYLQSHTYREILYLRR